MGGPRAAHALDSPFLPGNTEGLMHVLIVTNYFAPEGGAAAVRLTRLAKQLAARGHEVTVLTSLPHYPQGRIQDGYRGRFAMYVPPLMEHLGPPSWSTTPATTACGRSS